MDERAFPDLEMVGNGLPVFLADAAIDIEVATMFCLFDCLYDWTPEEI